MLCSSPTRSGARSSDTGSGRACFIAKTSQLAVTYLNLSKSTIKQDTELLLSAPVLGVVTATSNAPDVQVRSGQLLERIWLKATVLGLSLHPMNQVLQLPETRQQVTDLLPDGRHPQIIFRLGYGETKEKTTPRRKLEDVLL